MKCRVVDDERGFYLVETEYYPAAGHRVWSNLKKLLKSGLKIKQGDIIEIKKSE